VFKVLQELEPKALKVLLDLREPKALKVLQELEPKALKVFRVW
jgi:hypothetical protein